MSATTTVTIPYSEFEEIQKARREAETRAAVAEAKIIEAKIAASDPVLIELSLAALEVVRYAVASMPPESNRGWPFESLRKISGALPKAPFATEDHQTLAMTLGTFALECERHELRRKAAGGSSVITRPPESEIVAQNGHDQ